MLCPRHCFNAHWGGEAEIPEKNTKCMELTLWRRRKTNKYTIHLIPVREKLGKKYIKKWEDKVREGAVSPEWSGKGSFRRSHPS